MKSIPFLMSVWNHSCEQGDIVFLSTKDRSTGKFRDHSFDFNRGIRRRLKEWMRDHPASKLDIYFCPMPFSNRKRRKTSVKNLNILWSDIDDSKPKIKPTYLWESSPGRLQALWCLSGKPLEPTVVEDINKRLSYYNGADKSGWDITQVLRVPGTKNHKYDSLPEVRMVEYDSDRLYSPSRIIRRIGSADKPKDNDTSTAPSGMSYEQILSKFRRQIPAKVKRLLTQKHADTGKRSDIIWYLENKLSESGLSPDEIIVLIKNSAWNKYKGRADEDLRLRTEMEKIIEANVERTEVTDEQVEEQTFQGFTVESYREILSSVDSQPGWMVEEIWMSDSHGIVAGEPKTFKSTLALDLAVSIASAQPFLGKYEVIQSGPVLYVQNENARWIMKDRMSKIASHRGLVGEITRKGRELSIIWPPDMPLFMVNQQSFLLTDPLHQKILEKMLREIQPRLLILDPLYLMFDGDVNSARELNPVLAWLLEIKHKYNCGIMLIHHYNKGGMGNANQRGGQRMLGSTTLHGWIESAWYISINPKRHRDHELATIDFDREFRGAGLHPQLHIDLSMGDIGSADYDIEVNVHKEETKPNIKRGGKKNKQ